MTFTGKRDNDISPQTASLERRNVSWCCQMKGLVINLTRRRDRKKTINALLKKVKINHDFVTGIDGQQLKTREWRCYHQGKGRTRACWTAADGTRKVKQGQWGRIFTRGLVQPWAMVGACLSHEKAIGLALQRKDRSAIIFEDDAHVAPEDVKICKQILQAAVAAVPNFEIIQFGSHCAGITPTRRQKIATLPGHRSLCVAHRNYQAHVPCS